MTNASAFYFGERPAQIAAVAAAAIPAGINTKSALLDELYRRLRFPDYFGDNWDALEECIRDLSWLGPGAVIVEHGDVPLMGDVESLQTYLAILNDAVEKWSASGERMLVVVFPAEAEERIRSLLRASTAILRP